MENLHHYSVFKTLNNFNEYQNRVHMYMHRIGEVLNETVAFLRHIQAT